MRVLVTGDRGYIGTVMVPMLRAAGHDVTGLDTGLYEGCDLEGGPEPFSGQRRDIRDAGPGDLEGLDAVVCLAALSNDPLGHLNPAATYSINLDGTVNLARAARDAGVERFVFASSCSLYGAAGSAAVDESAPMNPVTPYGETKALAEKAISELAGDSFSPTFMRNATAYGASPRLRLDIVVNNLVGVAMTTGLVRLESDGTPWRPLVHVADISRAVVAVLDAPREVVHDEAFNVGRDEDNLQIGQVAEIVAATVPGSKVVLAPGAGPDTRDYRVDFAKLRDTFPDLKLGMTVPDGARELAAAYARHGLDRAGVRLLALHPPQADPGASRRRRRRRPPAAPARRGRDGGRPMSAPVCRLCGAGLTRTFVDLGSSPPCESYLRADQLDQPETFYPLHVRICDECLLVQLPAYVDNEEIFSDYAYFSSYSDSWVAHAERFVEQMTQRLGLGPQSLVVEVASNDGYLLQHAVRRGIPVLGDRARGEHRRGRPGARGPDRGRLPRRGLRHEDRRGVREGRPGRRQQRLRAHAGAARLRPRAAGARRGHRHGVPGVPAPAPAHRRPAVRHHLPRALLVLHAPDRCRDARDRGPLGRRCRGASHARRVATRPRPAVGGSRGTVGRRREGAPGRDRGRTAHGRRARRVRRRRARRQARAAQAPHRRLREGAARSPGYGAPGKGNTLLNHCGIRTDLLEYTVDRSPYKHGMFLPGTHIPIHDPSRARRDEAGPRTDPALEPARRDRRAALLRP